MNKNDSNLLTTTDVAKLCAVDATTVLHWIKSGKLKSYHTPGGHNRIFKEDLWEFIKENGLPFLGTEPRPDATKKKILIVDDDPDFSTILLTALHNENDWLIETAGSSLEAGLKVGSWRPDLLIMDLKMPGFNGLDFCRFLKKTFGYKNLPVIIVTAFYKNQEDHKKLEDLGVFDYLEKPFPTPTLVQQIRRFFGTHEASNGHLAAQPQQYSAAKI